VSNPKKKKPAKKPAAWDTSATSAYFGAQLNAIAVKDESMMDPASAAVAIVGLPLPASCLRYFFQRTTFPLERSLIAFGPTGSNKSAFLYEIYRWFIAAAGMYVHVEVEDKDTPILRLSMLDYDSTTGKVWQVETLDDMMRKVDRLFTMYRETAAKAGSPGRRMPFVIGVDSLVSKLTAGAIKTIDDNGGAPVRRYADEARALSDWYKLVPGQMRGYPICLLATNHDKVKQASMPGRQPEHYTPGGVAPGYSATYRVHMNNAGSTTRPDAEGYFYNTVRFKMDKCSLGTGKLQFQADFRWRLLPGLSETGQPIEIQYSDWEWHRASVELYERIAADVKAGAHRKAAAELGIVNAARGNYYCRALGHTAEDAMPAGALGALLETRRDVLDPVERALGVQSSSAWTADTDFADQLLAARARAGDFLPDSAAVKAARLAQSTTAADEVEYDESAGDETGEPAESGDQ
jgi:hypothetical protein